MSLVGEVQRADNRHVPDAASSGEGTYELGITNEQARAAGKSPRLSALHSPGEAVEIYFNFGLRSVGIPC